MIVAVSHILLQGALGHMHKPPSRRCPSRYGAGDASSKAMLNVAGNSVSPKSPPVAAQAS